MVNQLKFALIFVILAILASCSESSQNQLTFEMLESNKTVRLSNEAKSPLCSVSLKMACASEQSGKLGQKINETVVYRFFNQEGISMQSAMDRYTEAYTKSYKEHMLPLYNTDRADTTKRSWYEFHYIINSTVEHTSHRTLTYLATVDYSEGHAHSIHELVPINFYSDSGKEITYKNIFVDDFDEVVPALLLQALMEKTEVQTIGQLREKGYLNAMDMFVPEHFIVSDDAITFIYNPSEIASLDMGTIELVLTYAQLKKYIKPAFIKSLQ